MAPPARRLTPPTLQVLAIIPALAFVLLLIPQPLRFASVTWPSFYSDDFYYYVVIAQHFLSHGLSSFDGTTLTNGYHPLWMLLLAALLGLAGGAGKGFFLLLIAVQLLAYAAAIWQLARILARDGAPAPIIAGATLIFAVSFSTAAITGMEVIIAVPLIFAFIAEAQRAATPGGLRALRFGLAASAAILARIDAVILVGLVGLAILPALRNPRALLRAGAGLLPAALYFCINIAVFHTLLPLSSGAKALATPAYFNPVPLETSFLIFWQPVIALAVTIPAWCILGCALTGLFLWRRNAPAARLRTVICAFPPLFYLLLAIRSDWIIWEWYLYPIATAAPFAFAGMGKAAYGWNDQSAGPFMVAAGLLVGVLPAVLQVSGHAVNARPGLNSTFTQAVSLKPFITSHPGTYAMGDQAGSVAFVSGARLFQLEGLVEDKEHLDDIAHRTPLLSVLRKRHVTYYIGTEMQQDKGCWLGFEPKIYQAGPLSPEMTSRFCSPPVFGVKGTGNGHTLIFSVAAETMP